ncbi:GTPase HflX [Lactococcus petauri]|uniref:GTPase HflX n=1 Tax=Lactococcus TaxID=1357 RepID=UPI0002E901C8|nr:MULTISPECIES: GTPase HflX [Lactococcus]QQB43349.1 GTPase HflX [Lactococcus garvieae]MCR8688702.1 GTPase HflX [Lactococcus petauri]MDC0815611.1 GTPase HflX [Lactococcus petauri]MDC0817653.1 GTPase HflX [Lactococcus petauri]MDC0823957.1 GTPase HflX [Lactococcus petauri]
MINLEEKQERVLLVGVETFENSENFESSMLELAELTKTAGGLVIDAFTQKRDKYDTKFLIGSGKLEQMRWAIEVGEIDTVIFNDRLTPRQNINLEEALGIKVIDRMQLILDIFALRARSHEGMLQVEQAQLSYLLPRLVGQGIMLSRQGGGIGSKGPGESKLETDRRYIRTRIENIDKQLQKVEKTRETIRKKRKESSIFKIGLIGYTNAGKSSIMNALTEKTQYEKDELFATLDATTNLVKIKEDFTVSLTDTVGFIQDLPTELIKAFKSTLEESTHVDLLIHVIDASNPHHEVHEKTVQKLMEEMDIQGIPVLNVYNKMDIAKDFVPTLTPAVQLSIKSDEGVQWLRTAILEKLHELFVAFELDLPYAMAYKLPELKKIAMVNEVVEGETAYKVKGIIAPSMTWKLDNY